MKILNSTAAAMIALSAYSGPVLAHGEKKHGAEFGEKGDPAEISRTIDVSMIDNKFEPATISVRAGETVRFRVRNDGELVHEFNIGTAAMHEAHREEMMQMVQMGVLEADKINHGMMAHGSGGMMKHDDPNSVLLEPGQTADLIWKMPGSGTLQFACNVPGHYEDGMKGNFAIGDDRGS